MPSKIRRTVWACVTLSCIVLAAVNTTRTLPQALSLALFLASLLTAGLVVRHRIGRLTATAATLLIVMAAAASSTLKTAVPIIYAGGAPTVNYKVRWNLGNGERFDAPIFARAEKQGIVGRPALVTVWVCGPKVLQSNCADPAESPITAWNTATTTRSGGPIKGGARLLAALRPDSDNVQINKMTPQMEQLAGRTQRAQWLWSATARKAGTYQLAVSLTPLAADSERPFAPSKSIMLKLTVEPVPVSSVQAIFNKGKGPTNWIFGQIAALGFGAFLADALARRRDRRNLSAEAPEPEPSERTPASVTGS